MVGYVFLVKEEAQKLHIKGSPRDPITLSDDDQGVYNHLQNERY